MQNGLYATRKIAALPRISTLTLNTSSLCHSTNCSPGWFFFNRGQRNRLSRKIRTAVAPPHHHYRVGNYHTHIFIGPIEPRSKRFMMDCAQREPLGAYRAMMLLPSIMGSFQSNLRIVVAHVEATGQKSVHACYRTVLSVFRSPRCLVKAAPNAVCMHL